jgi:hypothetical protein
MRSPIGTLAPFAKISRSTERCSTIFGSLKVATVLEVEKKKKEKNTHKKRD